MEFLQHDYVTRQFYVTHFSGCAVLFNKHTFESLTWRSEQSTSLLRSQIVLAGLWRPSSPRLGVGRTPKNSKLHVTMISMHCQNTCAKKRSIALTMLLAVRSIMWHEKVDIVSCDYNGASWRCKSRQQQQSTASLRRRSRTPTSQCHAAPHRCG